MNRKDKSPIVSEKDITNLEALVTKWEKSVTQLQRIANTNQELEFVLAEKQVRNGALLEPKQSAVTNKTLKNSSSSNIKTPSRSSFSSLHQRNHSLGSKSLSSKTSICSRKGLSEDDSELTIRNRIEKFYEVRRRIEKMNSKSNEEKAFITLLETESIIN